MTKVNSEEYNKALEEYLQEGIGWDAGMFDINAKNNQGDYEQFAAIHFMRDGKQLMKVKANAIYAVLANAVDSLALNNFG